MSEHFLREIRGMQNRRGEICGSHLYLPHLYGVPISRYIKVIGNRARSKTKLGKAFEGMNHSGEQLRAMTDTILTLV